MTVTSYSRWTWSVALILVVALAILWATGHGPIGACCTSANDDAASKSAAVPPALTPPPPMQSVAKAPGTFAVRIDGDKRVIEGTVTDVQAKQRVLHSKRIRRSRSNAMRKAA
jgi:hypothetical protein